MVTWISCQQVCMVSGDWFIIIALHQGPKSTLARLDILLILFQNICASKIKDRLFLRYSTSFYRLFTEVQALIILSYLSSMSSSRSVSPFMSQSQSTCWNVAILPVQNKDLP